MLDDAAQRVRVGDRQQVVRVGEVEQTDQIVAAHLQHATDLQVAAGVQDLHQVVEVEPDLAAVDEADDVVERVRSQPLQLHAVLLALAHRTKQHRAEVVARRSQNQLMHL